MAKVVCPKCGKPGYLSFKVVKGKRYSYVAHKESGKVKWCYLGKPTEEPSKVGVAAEPSKLSSQNSPPEDPSNESSRQPTDDEVKKYFAKLRACSKPEYTDEELLKAIVKDARNDYFCGTGRIFISEFTKWYGCSRERLLNVLEKSNLKWRLDPNGVVVLIDL